MNIIKSKQWCFIFFILGLLAADWYLIYRFDGITKINDQGKMVEAKIVYKSRYKGWKLWVEYQYLNQTYTQTIRLSSEKMKEYKNKNSIDVKFLPSNPNIITCEDDKTVNLLILWFVLINIQIWRYGKRLIRSFGN